MRGFELAFCDCATFATVVLVGGAVILIFMTVSSADAPSFLPLAARLAAQLRSKQHSRSR